MNYMPNATPIFVAPGVGFFPRPVICVNACVFFVSFIGTSCHYSCYRPFPSLPGSALPGPRVTLSSCPVLYFWPFLDVLALWLLRSTVLCPRDYSPHTDNKSLLKNKEGISKSMEKILGTHGIKEKFFTGLQIWFKFKQDYRTCSSSRFINNKRC